MNWKKDKVQSIDQCVVGEDQRFFIHLIRQSEFSQNFLSFYPRVICSECLQGWPSSTKLIKYGKSINLQLQEE